MAKAKPGSDRVHGSKSAAIRAMLTENPKMPVREVVAALADRGIKVNPNLAYFVKGLVNYSFPAPVVPLRGRQRL